MTIHLAKVLLSPETPLCGAKEIGFPMDKWLKRPAHDRCARCRDKHREMVRDQAVHSWKDGHE